jgi:hypothetical protein
MPVNGSFAPGAAVYPESLFQTKNKRPRGHSTAWPLRNCPLGPPEISVSGRIRRANQYHPRFMLAPSISS